MSNRYAAAKVKIKDRFTKVPLWWAEQAAQVTHTKKAMVWILLLYMSWEAHGKPFKAPNKRFAAWGVSRHTKVRVLRKLEQAGLISVVWTDRKSPLVTVLYL